MTNLFKYLLSTALLLCLTFAPNTAKSQYISGSKDIVAHKNIKLNLPNAQRLTIIYRPGSNISDTVRVPLNNDIYQWTPREAGIVALKTPNGPQQTVSVRFAATPLGGMLILFGAAFILFGGAIFAAIKLF